MFNNIARFNTIIIVDIFHATSDKPLILLVIFNILILQIISLISIFSKLINFLTIILIVSKGILIGNDHLYFSIGFFW